MAETVGKIEVVIKGGKPWGFRLQSISENRSTVTITEILPGGKADLHGKLKVGDNIIKINGIQCLSLEDALQLIESAFRTLTILVWRGSNCSEAIVSYGNQISKPFLAQPFSTQNGNGSAFTDSYNVESSPIYENLQDFSHEKVQNNTNFYHGHGLENSFQYSNSKNILVTLLDNNSSGSINVKKHVRDSNHFSPLGSSNSHITNSNIKWKKQSFSENVELNHNAGVKLATGICTQFNSVNLRENIKKEKKLLEVECDYMGANTQSINKQIKRNIMSTWTEKNGCIYPNCQNASQTCTKHSPPERDFVKLNFKQILLSEPTQSSFLKVNNEKLPSPIGNSNKSKNDIDYHIGMDSSSVKNCATVNSSVTTSKAELNNMNIYSNISYLNSFSQNNLNEDIYNLSDKINCQTIPQNCVAGNPNTSSSNNIKESFFPNTFSSNKNLLSTNMMNELNQKSLYTNQIYSNVTYSNLKSNIQLRKNNFSDISYQNITNKENLDLISASQISDNIKTATENFDEKIVNKETNTSIDRSFSSCVPSFSKCAKLKNLITSGFAIGGKCLIKDNLVYKKNNPVVSRYENIPIQFHSLSKSSEVIADTEEKSSDNLSSFENSVSRFSDSWKDSAQLFRVHSNPSDVSLLDPENNEERSFSDDESNVLTSSNPNYENISFVSTSIPEISVNDIQKEKNLVEYKTTSFDLQKNNLKDKTLFMIYNKSSISTSVFKYSTICSENNQNNMDQDLQLLNIHKFPEASLVMEGKQTPPLPSPPPETETEIFESDEPLPPPPQFPHNLNQEFQNDSQVVQAVYANIEMLKVQCSLVSSATQTTLQRKDNSRMKDFPDLQIDPLQSITVEDQESHSQKNNCKVSTQVQNYHQPKKNSLNLPLTSPYFTTSVPKAKLLTQHTSKFEGKNFHIDNELSSEKEVLIDSIAKKLQILKHEKDALEEELKQNEELGKSLTTKLEKLATETETQKFKLYVEELEKITNLLLSLSGRLARTENALLILPSESSEEKEVLQDKYKKLSQQYDEAVHLQDNIEKRNKHVSLFLCKYFSRDELIDYDHFVHMKVKLLVDYKDLIEKIKLGEEQLYTLKGSFNAEYCNEFKSKVK